MKITEELIRDKIRFYSKKINELNMQTSSPTISHHDRIVYQGDKKQCEEKLDFLITFQEIFFEDNI